MTQDYPDGFRRNLPGHTVDLEAGFSLPWCEDGELTIAASGNSSFTLSFSDPDFIYFIDMINVSPQAYTEFFMFVYVDDVVYMSGANMGFLIMPLRTNPSINFLNGDSVKVQVYNRDASQRTFKIYINGSKIVRPSTYGHPPSAHYSLTPVFGFTPLSVVFTDESAFTPTSWEWSINGVDVDSVSQNPTISVVNAGRHSPLLKAINQYGYDTYSSYHSVHAVGAFPLSTFTESDAGGYISGLSYPITVTNIIQNSNSYIVGDYGVDYIDDYDILIAAKLSSGDLYCIFPVLVLGNHAPCLVSGGGICLSVFFNRAASGTYKIFIQLFDGVSAGSSDSYTCSLDTYYYMRLVHTSGSTTITLYIYSDAAFTTLVDTLTITHANCATKYRYALPISSHNDGTTKVSSGVISKSGMV